MRPRTRRSAGALIATLPPIAELERRLATKNLGQEDHLFPVAERKTCKMMKVDVEAAGLDYETTDGFADFHAHRVAFITNLSRSGADFGTVVKLARHSDPKLTAKIYDKVNLEAKRAAINGMVKGTKG